MDRGGSDWALFVDWCVAAGEQALPASPGTVLAFFEDAPAGRATLARRARAIDAAHSTAGAGAPGRDALVASSVAGQRDRYDPQAVARALRSAPVGGWPASLVGRRDAAIVALVCAAGLSRDQVRRLRGLDVAWAAGRLDIGSPPGACPRCALSRWHSAWLLVAAAGWRMARVRIEELGAALAEDAVEHDCSRSAGLISARDGPPALGAVTLGAVALGTAALDAVELGAVERWPLFSPIGHQGQVGLGRPLSRRSLTAVVSARLGAVAPMFGAAAHGLPGPAPVLAKPPPSPAEQAAQLGRLDELCVVLERVGDEAEACLLAWAGERGG